MSHYPNLEHTGEGLAGIDYDNLYDGDDTFLDIPVTISLFVHTDIETGEIYDIDTFDISFKTDKAIPITVLKDIGAGIFYCHDVDGLNDLPREYPLIVEGVIETCNNNISEIKIISCEKELVAKGANIINDRHID